jgi:hypothetical protein
MMPKRMRSLGSASMEVSGSESTMVMNARQWLTAKKRTKKRTTERTKKRTQTKRARARDHPSVADPAARLLSFSDTDLRRSEARRVPPGLRSGEPAGARTCVFPPPGCAETHRKHRCNTLWRRHPTSMPFLFYLRILRFGVLASLRNRLVSAHLTEQGFHER